MTEMLSGGTKISTTYKIDELKYRAEESFNYGQEHVGQKLDVIQPRVTRCHCGVAFVMK